MSDRGNKNPLLGHLASNGGPAQTLLPGADGPADDVIPNPRTLSGVKAPISAVWPGPGPTTPAAPSARWRFDSGPGDGLDDRQAEADTGMAGAYAFGAALERSGECGDQLW